MNKTRILAALLTILASCSETPGIDLQEPSSRMMRTQNMFRNIAQRSMPAVVHIYSLESEKKPSYRSLRGSGYGPFEALKKYVTSHFVVTYRVGNAGTGFIINKRGYILTNHHVVAGSDQILVKIGSIEREGNLLGTDPLTDIALVKINADYRYGTLKMGDSDMLEVGEWVVAIGNPYSLGRTFTAGVVSALRRDDLGIVEIEDFIQTDAAINPGNSGGPLINMNGEVVGINTAIYSNASGVGFSVPINIAKNILSKLVAGEHIRRGLLGVEVTTLTKELAGENNLSVNEGVIVVRVSPGSPADIAGITPGDVINGFNGKKVSSYHDLRKAVLLQYAGSTVEMELIRDGKRLTLIATLALLKPEL